MPESANPESTATLLSLVRGGDAAARERLVARYLPLLRRWARGRLPQRARDLNDTSDLVQITLLSALNQIERFRPRREGAFLAYLRTALMNAIRMELRRVGRRGAVDELPEDDRLVVDSALARELGVEDLMDYEAALAKLTPLRREAVILRFEFGMNFAEIAAALGRNTAGAAHMLVSRALVDLASALEPVKAPRDPALDIALRLAAGEALDDSELAATPHLARGLKRLAAITRSLRPEAATGATWGHLQRLEPAGSGSFGEVFRAWDPTLDRTVALKLRRRDAPSAIHSGRDFIAEAQRLARVRHPHVLAVHGASYHDDRAGIWTDWIEGETLHARLQREGRLPSETLLVLGQELATALAAVHEAGLVHGDVKAGNVMLDGHGHAVLMDFGAGFKSSDDASVLAAGTPRYLAPEVAQGGNAGSAVDVYALAVLLHVAACGAYPQPGRPDPRLRPRGLSVLLADMLATDPARRPAAIAVAEALRHLRQAPLRRARLFAAATLVLALLALALVSAWGYRRAEALRRETAAALQRSEAANEFLTELLSRAQPHALGPTATLRDLLDSAPALVQQRFARRPADRAALFETLAEIETGLSNDAAAAAHTAAAAQALAEIAPRSDEVLRLQGEALRRRALAGDAEAVWPQAQQLLELAMHEQRPERLQSQLTLALAEIEWRVQLVRPDPELRARILARLETLVARAEHSDPDTAADALRRLATLRIERGDDTESVALARRAVAISERAHGRDHPNPAQHRLVLAWYLMEAPGGAPEAEALVRLNLALYGDKVGRQSRTWFENSMALVYALTHQERAAEALTLAREVAELGPRLYGIAHRSSFDASLTLAEALQQTGHASEAERELRAVGERIAQSWGRENRHYLLAARQLALLLESLQRAPEAQPYFRECAGIGRRVLGEREAIVRDCETHLTAPGATVSE